MNTFRKLFCIALICALAAITGLSQDSGGSRTDCRQKNGELERKDDRFSGEATVTLKPQTINTMTPGQELKMALEYKIKSEHRGRMESFIPEMVNIVFTSTSRDRIYDSELELIFLIDGERVRRVPGAVHDEYSQLSEHKILTQTIFTGMSIETLRRIIRAKSVVMKLGNTEVELNVDILKALRSFAGCALSNN